jgi:hypothetical protein
MFRFPGRSTCIGGRTRAQGAHPSAVGVLGARNGQLPVRRRLLTTPSQNPMCRDRPVCVRADRPMRVWASLPSDSGISNLYQTPRKSISVFLGPARLTPPWAGSGRSLRGTCRPRPLSYPGEILVSILALSGDFGHADGASRVSFADRIVRRSLTSQPFFRAPHARTALSLRTTMRGALRPDCVHGGHARSSPIQRPCDGDRYYLIYLFIRWGPRVTESTPPARRCVDPLKLW